MKSKLLTPAAAVVTPAASRRTLSTLTAVPHSPGRRLDADTRAFMEPRFGHDFGRVRVHTDARAAESARALGALAYTVGSDVVFDAGRYTPATPAGRRLLAHELAHVVQQSSGLSHADAGATDSLERAADAQADQAVSGNLAAPARPPRPLGPPPHPIVQCYTVPGTLRCDQIVDWLDTNSPYLPEWAATPCEYTYNDGLKVSSAKQPDGSWQVTLKGTKGLTVSASCPIDLPQWSPTKRPNRDKEAAAWKAMLGTLRTHEKRHQKIGEEWRGKLEERYRAVNVTASGATKDEAQAKALEQVLADKAAWGAEAQAAQDAIDPFRGATLTCPP